MADVVAGVVADGGKQLGDLVAFGDMQIGFVEDPWGTKIEIIDDPDLRGMHHLHLTSPDPEGTLDWYGENFGGERELWKGALPALDYGDVLAASEPGEWRSCADAGPKLRSSRLEVYRPHRSRVRTQG